MTNSNEEKFLLAGIEDKIVQCEERYMVTNTPFLDMRQRSLAEGLIRNRKLKRVFWGGYPEAERCCLVCLPEYTDTDPSGIDIFRDSPEDDPLAVIRAAVSGKAGKLNHRDYLGSLMALGIKREFTGDILVRPDGADIVVLKEIKDYILMNFGQAGHTRFSVEEVPVADIRIPEQKIKEKTDTAASTRLDSMIASAFSVSRTSAAAAIRGGLVFVNCLQIEKPDFQVKEGDKLVFRGKGKACLSEIGGKSRKDRIYVKFQIFL